MRGLLNGDSATVRAPCRSPRPQVSSTGLAILVWPCRTFALFWSPAFDLQNGCTAAAEREPFWNFLPCADGGLASDFALHVLRSNLPAGPRPHSVRPSPLLPPTAVIATQLEALQRNDYPEVHCCTALLLLPCRAPS